jgi:hypothetical protein
MNHHAFCIEATGDTARSEVDAVLKNSLSATAHELEIAVRYQFSHITVSEARRVVEMVAYGSSDEGRKFIIIFSASFPVLAQNSLLKALEEPPARTIIILVTTSYTELLPTVASRVQQLTNKKKDTLLADEFLSATPKKRSESIDVLIKELKSDKDGVADTAKERVGLLLRQLQTRLYNAKEPKDTMPVIAKELITLIPLSGENGFPLKQLLEHLKIVQATIPKM